MWHISVRLKLIIQLKLLKSYLNYFQIQNRNKKNLIKFENNKTKNLTRRQKQIVNLLMQENSNSEIADFLGYSISTIKQEISKIYSELGVRNREDLIEYLSGFTSQLEKL